MRIIETDALIVVDVQNDFCSGGALPVPEGENVVAPINRIMGKFDYVAFSQDWHPETHLSFSFAPEYRDGSWPEHCVQDTPGAEFRGDLRVPLDSIFVKKGTEPGREAYSAFDGTGLAETLRSRQVKRVFITGLALDYCVKATALDALREGFQVCVVEDAVKSVTQAGKTAALEELRQAGVLFCASGSLQS